MTGVLVVVRVVTVANVWQGLVVAFYWIKAWTDNSMLIDCMVGTSRQESVARHSCLVL